MITTNEGILDRALRIVIGAALLYLGLGGVVAGALGTTLSILGALALLTGLIGWCAVYSMLGIDTTGRHSGRTAPR
jgi:hypothetical protein